MKRINDLVEALGNAKYNPDEIRSMVSQALDDALNNLIKEKYVIVKFDSPEGRFSETKLKEEGYTAKWYGPIGHRGETYIYLPRPVQINTIPALEHKLHELELLDGGSHITVM